MSGFAVIYERTNTSSDSNLLNQVMERLAHRGPDGSNTLKTGSASMGHWHFWTTPEEVGERQPLSLDGLPFKIVLDGMIDNRAELFSKLQIFPSQENKISDAALILRAYSHWGENCFEHFVGAYALVIYDERRDQLICARDHLGDRTLFYSEHNDRVVIASEPWAVLAAFPAKSQLDESTIAQFFAVRDPEDGRTFFENVRELLPAHIMRFNASTSSPHRYWQPNPDKKIRYETEQEYANQFLTLLEESVRCRMRSTTPVGVFMSGGLDSTSIACLAARMLGTERLTVISNIYDELDSCDERNYINDVQQKWNMRSIQIPSDSIWTFKDWDAQKVNPNQPAGNVYQLVKERNYQHAKEEGLRVVFNGEAGDPLYLAGNEWIADLIFEGKFHALWRGLKLLNKTKGMRYLWDAGHLRATIRAILKKYALWLLKMRRRYQNPAPAWLIQSAKEYLQKHDSPVIPPALERHKDLLGSFYAASCARENAAAHHYHIEIRHPYRDRRLVEFVIGLPAYMLHYGGTYKHILRLAMQGILPESVRARKKATFLTPLFLRGVERERKILEDNLNEKHHAWQNFVQPAWLKENMNFSAPLEKENGGSELFVAWLCISYEKWIYSFSH